MDNILGSLLIVCPFIFLAAFIDAIAGGGGIISLPAYMATGIPIHYALGSNKFSACFGSILASYRFYKQGLVQIRTAVISGAAALIGSTIGARLTFYFSDGLFKKLLLCVIPLVAFFILSGKKQKIEIGTEAESISKKKSFVIASMIGFFIGGYDGFFGPGAGTFMLLANTSFLKMDIRTASGNAKIANLASNVAAMTTFALAGKVMYVLAIPATFCSIAGAYAGSHVAMNKDTKYIKHVIIIVLILLFIKIIIG